MVGITRSKVIPYSTFHMEKPLCGPAFTLRFVFTAFTHRSFDAEAFPQRSFYTQKPLHTHTDACTQSSFDTQTLLHREAVTQSNFYTEELLHTDAFTQRSFSIQTLLHIEAFTHRSFYAQRFSHGSFTQRSI